MQASRFDKNNLNLRSI